MAAGAAGACLAVLLAIAASAAVPRDLRSAKEKEIAMELVGSAENSSLDWRAQYGYIEDIHDGRGYTGGIIGFTSGTGDMLEVLGLYTRARSSNPLVPFLRALRDVNGTSSHRGLGRRFVIAWRRAARDPRFQRAQQIERDKVYFDPAVALAKSDGLRALEASSPTSMPGWCTVWTGCGRSARAP